MELDKRILGNIDPKEIINFHHLDSNLNNYLCILSSDGKFKKILFDEEMLKSNRIFSITKLKNSTNIIDSFTCSEEHKVIILTSIGRIFKFDLSNKYLKPTSKQSQGISLVKLLPREKIVSCCKSKEKDLIFLVSKKGKFFSLIINEIYDSYNSKLGYVNEKIQLSNDYFIKVLLDNEYIDFETNKNKSARINLTKFTSKPDKNILKVDFLNLEKDEYLENCFCLENLIN